jgi:MGT family glycosyltransferase
MRALSSRGHEVVSYTTARFSETVEKMGAEPRTYQSAPDIEFERINELFPERPKKAGLKQALWDLTMVVDLAEKQYADLEKIAETEAFDVVVTDAMALSGQLFAEKRQLPLAAVNAMNLFAPSRDTPADGLGMSPSSSPLGRIRNRLTTWLMYDVALGSVNRHLHQLRERLGLPRLAANLFAMPFEISQLFLQPSVPSFEYPRSDLPPQVHFVGALPPPPPSDWSPPEWWPRLHQDKPVVVVTQGTVATDFDDLLHPTLRGLAAEDVFVVAATGKQHRHKVEGHHDNAVVEAFVPFDELLPHADVFVTNGGYGGIHFALRHGVPLVVAGQSEDKAETCARVRFSGVGIDLETTRAKPNDIRRAVRKVLREPSYKARVAEIRSELELLDGPSLGADMLERLAETRALIPRDLEPA